MTTDVIAAWVDIRITVYKGPICYSFHYLQIRKKGQGYEGNNLFKGSWSKFGLLHFDETVWKHMAPI